MNLGQLIQLSRAYQADPLTRYAIEPPGQRGGMSPPQRSMHQSKARKRAFLAANKVGKSYWGSAEAWFHMMGRHPFRDVPEPGSTGWVLCSDLRTGWEVISDVMHELEPPGVLHESCKYVPGVGYLYRGTKQIMWANGASMGGKGWEQSLLALESKRIQWAWIDEPPKEAHFHGLRARLTMDVATKGGGNIFLTMTPVGRPCEWLRRILEGSIKDNVDPEPDWHVEHIELSLENAPHRTEEDIEAQKMECSPWEYNQRIKAEWDGVTKGRWVSGFSEANIFDDDHLPTQVESVGLGWDHGELPGKSVCYLVAWDGFTVWVLDEYTNEERSTPSTEAQGVADMCRKWGVALTDIDKAVGDSNSAGKLGIGFTINELIMREFAKLTGGSRPPFEIRVPYKRRGSIDARVRLLSMACVDGRFRVHHGCTKLISSLRHWRGGNDDLKDAFDAVSYISELYVAPGAEAKSEFMIWA